MPSLKRWAPLVGSAVLVASVGLRLAGQTQAADSIEALANVVGLSAQSPVSGTEIASAAAALVGIVLKLAAEAKKARGNSPA